MKKGFSIVLLFSRDSPFVHDSPADWCKSCGFGVKGTKVSTVVACYILNEIGYGPLHDSTS